jgi:hypothetical protein
LQSAGGKSQDWADVAELVHQAPRVRKATDRAKLALERAVKRELGQAVRAFLRSLSRDLAIGDETGELSGLSR